MYWTCNYEYLKQNCIPHRQVRYTQILGMTSYLLFQYTRIHVCKSIAQFISPLFTVGLQKFNIVQVVLCQPLGYLDYRKCTKSGEMNIATIKTYTSYFLFSLPIPKNTLAQRQVHNQLMRKHHMNHNCPVNQSPCPKEQVYDI